MTTTTIELVTYRLKSGTDKQQLDDIHPVVNDFLKQQPGFLYRSLSEDATGQLYDIVYWQNQEAANQASLAFQNSDAGQQLMAVSDMESVNFQHMSAITEAMSCESAN